ncbi:pyridoxal phosphatase [Siccibacter turicensis]|uniref:Pyridoxal phosphatase n=1 Tax=Siccibacter turicensis TaxID=357233 RepID=A0A2P8VQ68_9ENTR|nr:pyridoxal phosphatase [Siccibacter turicensis]PSN09540.1 pyridoxal phosphatase [Siccibacter turicensis]
MTLRVIALDLDGTLLTPQKTILPESLDALRHAREAGFTLAIVTGRHHVAIHPFYQALELDTPAICCNGAYLYDYHAKKVLSADPLRPDQAVALTGMLQTHHIHGLMYVDDAMMYETATGHVLRTQNWAQRLPEHQRPVFTQVPSLQEAAHSVEAIWKFALTDIDTLKLNAFATEVEQTLGLVCEWSWHDQVDVAQKGNSKGARLAQWLATQGLGMENVVAFGDNYNDLSMLEPAGLGFAMGNADDAIKARADKVIGDNTQPSIAEALYQYVL